ncbi:MAG: DUF4145 domain-containing protein [Clostridiales bacterium]|jgi:ribosomal protein S27AE|nr:DUF4145 domain-containing protein [Clostridiales bacterium]MCI1961130.1 DUF4145 domain-containing protein [Clostridiales bacterium]MCI2021571.1 DUF4145 domain-containing protein [Clostridiales bacterium]MCI2026357.1 DUF4145 domain-containing protein [Clostridiales bacterium]
MSTFVCPYCGVTVPEDWDTINTFEIKDTKVQTVSLYSSDEHWKDCLKILQKKCPECGNYFITAKGTGGKYASVDCIISPKSLAKHFPNYIPAAIRSDYEEAYLILKESPKASATLSRRCLQGMIHDFWNIHGKNLNTEISQLHTCVSPTMWKAIDGLRKLGNIGAHMEIEADKVIDIEPDEAEKLLKLIELLIEKWYISRHDEEKLYSDIVEINEEKVLQKK